MSERGQREIISKEHRRNTHESCLNPAKFQEGLNDECDHADPNDTGRCVKCGCPRVDGCPHDAQREPDEAEALEQEADMYPCENPYDPLTGWKD